MAPPAFPAAPVPIGSTAPTLERQFFRLAVVDLDGWSVMPETFRGVAEQVRTTIAEFVGELFATSPASDAPTREAADQAVSYAVGGIGERAHVVKLTGQATTGGTSSLETALAPAPAIESESWWTRWRKRGLIIGGATVVAAVAGVATWLEWNPFT